MTNAALQRLHGRRIEVELNATQPRGGGADRPGGNMTDSRFNSRTHRMRQRNAGNCFVWGCLSLFCFAVLVTIVAALVARYELVKIRENYTAPQAVALPKTEMPQDDLDALLSRYDEFADAMRKHRTTEALELDETELNAIIQNHADFRDVGEHAYLRIDEDVITGEISISLDSIPFFEGRFFNGTGTFDISLQNGFLWISLVDASVKGNALPRYIMEQLRLTNLAEDAGNDPDLRELIDGIDSIEVEDGKLVITPVSN